MTTEHEALLAEADEYAKHETTLSGGTFPTATNLIARLAAALRAALALIDEHNAECAEVCGIGDQEGVRCKYRPYFPRHCPECPRNWMIDAARASTKEPQK